MEVDVQYESRFWMGQLRDHMEFIEVALPHKYKAQIDEAIELKNEAARVVNLVENYQGIEINAQVLGVAQRILNFKRRILNGSVQRTIEINLSSGVILHLIWENIIFIGLLEGDVPTAEDARIMALKDTCEHADQIKISLDPSESEYRKELYEFKKKLEKLIARSKEYRKINTLGGINEAKLSGEVDVMVIGLPYGFPAEEASAQLVNTTLTEFEHTLANIARNNKNKYVLGFIYPLLSDHMYRELQYWMGKLRVLDPMDALRPLPY